MAKRQLPVSPNLEQLRHQAKDLLRAIRRGEAAALEDLAAHHPERVEPATAKLADAQLALARSYGVPSWPRLVIACKTMPGDVRGAWHRVAGYGADGRGIAAGSICSARRCS